MSRVVLDTNVVFAAFATRGLCESVFELCLEQHELITSEFLLDELHRKFEQKLKLPPPTIEGILTLSQSQSRTVTPAKIDARACRDQEDLAVLGTCVTGEADTLITGDRDLLTLEAFQGTQIVTPRKFYETQRGRP